jgi:hypothetical protein
MTGVGQTEISGHVEFRVRGFVLFCSIIGNLGLILLCGPPDEALPEFAKLIFCATELIGGIVAVLACLEEAANEVNVFAGVSEDIVMFFEVNAFDVLFCTCAEADIEMLPAPSRSVDIGLLGFGADVSSPGYIGGCIAEVFRGSAASSDVAIGTSPETFEARKVKMDDASVTLELPNVVDRESARTAILDTPVVSASRLPTATLPAWTS